VCGCVNFDTFSGQAWRGENCARAVVVAGAWLAGLGSHLAGGGRKKPGWRRVVWVGDWATPSF